MPSTLTVNSTNCGMSDGDRPPGGDVDGQTHGFGLLLLHVHLYQLGSVTAARGRGSVSSCFKGFNRRQQQSGLQAGQRGNCQAGITSAPSAGPANINVIAAIARGAKRAILSSSRVAR